MNIYKIVGALLIFFYFSAACAFAEEEAPDFTELRKYGELAYAAYQTEKHIEATCKEFGYQLVYSGASTTTNVGFFIAKNETTKTLLISVRGTSNVENVIVDIDYNFQDNALSGVRLHNGFAQSATSIYKDVKDHLIPGYKITTTGHSLGRTIALILAMYLDRDEFKIHRVVTFGQPKVTNRSGANEYKHLHVYRVVTEKDAVPIVPPFDTSQLLNLKMDVFWHLGTEFVLLPGSYYATLQGLDSLLRGVEFITKQPTQENIQAHQMKTYLDLIQAKIDSPTLIPFDERSKFIDEPSPAQAETAADSI
jgi:hypothetical protein